MAVSKIRVKARKYIGKGMTFGNVFHDIMLGGFTSILRLSKSHYISSKLLAFSNILFLWITSMIAIHWIFPEINVYSIMFLLVFSGALIINNILSLLYLNVLSVLVEISRDKILSLRVGLFFLFFALPVSTAGLLFNNQLFIQLALACIIMQFLSMVFTNFVDYARMRKNGNRKLKGFDIGEVLGMLGSAATVLSLIVTGILIAFGKIPL